VVAADPPAADPPAADPPAADPPAADLSAARPAQEPPPIHAREDALAAALDSLGRAHHRPYSRA
jgi:hypothetical protein